MNHSTRTASSIELLEDRIAPASLLPGGKIVTFTDIDGDAVTVTLSKALLTAGNVGTVFKFTGSAFGDSGPQQISLLDLHALGGANGVDISAVAKRSPTAGGNGAIDIPTINASDVNVANGTGLGIDLGRVVVQGNVDYIDAGDTDLNTPAIASLTLRSLGSVSDGRASDIFGSVSVFKVRGDLQGNVRVEASPGNGAKANIGTLTVGGSVGPGFDDPDAGHINVNGSIGTATIGHDLHGSIKDRTGYLQVTGSITELTIGGSIVGEGGFLSGCVIVGGKIGKLTVGGDIAGGSGAISGSVGGGSIGKAKIGGSIRGFYEPGSQFQAGVGVLAGEQGIGRVTVKGSVIAGSIVAGISPGVDGLYGTDDDSDTNPGVVAVIGKITIKGTVNGTNVSGDSYGIEANKILELRVGSVLYSPSDPLLSFSTGFFLSATGDVKVRTL
ncbi:MAG: hypothetical protein ABIO94_11505 [Opitutaceae bacterium]